MEMEERGKRIEERHKFVRSVAREVFGLFVERGLTAGEATSILVTVNNCIKEAEHRTTLKHMEEDDDLPTLKGVTGKILKREPLPGETESGKES